MFSFFSFLGLYVFLLCLWNVAFLFLSNNIVKREDISNYQHLNLSTCPKNKTFIYSVRNLFLSFKGAKNYNFDNFGRQFSVHSQKSVISSAIQIPPSSDNYWKKQLYFSVIQGFPKKTSVSVTLRKYSWSI